MTPLHTCVAVSATLRRTASDASSAAAECSGSSRARHGDPRAAALVAAGVSIAALAPAAAAVVRFGPEYVDEIPPADPIVTGSIEGERYWVVDGRETKHCIGHPSDRAETYPSPTP